MNEVDRIENSGRSKSPIQKRAAKQILTAVYKKYGGDDRIRTCGSLLDYNDLANRRFQPLSHVSEMPKGNFQF